MKQGGKKKKGARGEGGRVFLISPKGLCDKTEGIKRKRQPTTINQIPFQQREDHPERENTDYSSRSKLSEEKN